MRRGVVALLALLTAVSACSSSGSGPRVSTPLKGTTAPASAVFAPSTSTAAAPSTSSPSSSSSSSSAPSISSPSARRTAGPTHSGSAAARSHTGTRVASGRLPLDLTTGAAQQVVTVVAASHSSTTATLQAWQRSGTGWQRVGPAVDAHLGSDGLGQASESSTRTPAGSFTLTQAFGHDPDPGTSLPYTRTTPDDWWISQPGPLYNTRQRCSSGCAFTRGDPNEHLYYETPYYDFAVVIDYNTPNSPGGVRAGAGSAFFLHVTGGTSTAGCVSIPKDQLATILRWLRPAAQPRILLGVD